MSTDDAVQLVSWRVKLTLRGQLWVFTSQDGTRYSTENSFLASLCKASIDQQRPVLIGSAMGWFDRTIYAAQWPEERPSDLAV